jgi:hypothetical protein
MSHPKASIDYTRGSRNNCAENNYEMAILENARQLTLFGEWEYTRHIDVVGP